jgi:NAD+ kinase
VKQKLEVRRADVLVNPSVGEGYLERLVAVLEKGGVEVGQVSNPEDGRPTTDETDVVFVLGGDGTMLRATRMHPERLLVGIKLGNVGFMSGIRPEDIESGVEEILTSGLHVQEYRMLEVRVTGEEGRHFAVNDAVLVKRQPHQITSVEVSVGGEGLVSYQCDGLVAATPLGSTAYALSAGGPIVSGDVGCYTLVPIAPHSLISRPLVLGEHQPTELMITERGAMLSIDGQEPQEIPPGGRIDVRLSEKSVRIGRTDEWTWWRAVRRTFL